ncbi:hypothetical protein J2Z60_000152 [Lactobacillus colini]|uniref:Nucleotide modification associated domain-containing protein n=1 Tax=Lactobacillus colini TaxID=1819254 RepID=A0ABS4MBF7_9LACO|nr:nucleotide modification associated domain-containing protein [Lactobacillus colini]MBP2056990.1 hypothetical protein [Lactobacillus colini]
MKEFKSETKVVYSSKELENPFLRYTDELAQVLLQKNKAYGDSFTKSVDDYGLPVIGIRLSDKYNRIHTLITKKDIDVGDESLQDTLLDTAGYAILAYKYLKENESDAKTKSQ